MAAVLEAGGHKVAVRTGSIINLTKTLPQVYLGSPLLQNTGIDR